MKEQQEEFIKEQQEIEWRRANEARERAKTGRARI